MSLLLSFLKSKLAAFGAVIVIVLVLAIGGPMIFGIKWRLWFWLAAALVLVVFLIYMMVKAWQAKRKARLLEGFLKKQAEDQVVSSRPDVKDELGAIKEKLDKAIAILKRSRLTKAGGGAEALYVLPWYMIIGPSAAGKSTALRNSGLNFPPIDTDSADPGRVKGLGGTRNCDWWFTNEGIILDTAGRYTISSQGAEDREEWTKFLLMLKKARPRAPINGLLLAVSMDDILRKGEDERVEMAKALRARIDELIVRLEILFPIYVIFTKCDLIAGFGEFFGDYNRDWREQVWGYTRKYEPTKTPLQQEFAAECARLKSVLDQRRMRQLATEVRPVNRRATYLFPLEFESACHRLGPFVETLFAPNPYQQNPVVRGFYFTSGTQEGAPIAQVMEAMRRDYGLSSAPMPSAPPAEPKAYFVRDVFQEIILPDESYVSPTTSAEKRRRLGRLLFLGGASAFALLMFVVFLNTYLRNRRAVEYLAAETSNVMMSTSQMTGFSLPALDSLEVLRGVLERVERGPGLLRHWGLYFGEIPIMAARQAYFRRLRTLFIEPTARGLEPRLRALRGFSGEAEEDRYFQIVSAYLMMTGHYDSTDHDLGALLAEADTVWRPTIIPADRRHMEDLLDAHLRYYWAHRSDMDLKAFQVAPDRALLAEIELAIAGRWSPRRLYRKIVNESNAQFHGDFTMGDAAPSTLRLQEGSRVGRAFTREGWSKHVRPRIENMPAEIRANPSMAKAFPRFDEAKLKEDLTSRYTEEFLASWRSFLDRADLVPIGNLEEAAAVLEEMSTPESPIVGVLKVLYENSKLDIGGRHEDQIEREFEPIGKFLGEVSMDGAGDIPVDLYLKLLADLPGATEDAAKDLQKSGRCAAQIKDLNAKLSSADRAIGRLGSQTKLPSWAADWLLRPLEAARSAGSGEVCACLNRQWDLLVYSSYRSTLEPFYPFNVSSESEAPYTSVVSFFTTSGGIFAFDDAEGRTAREENIPLSGAYLEAIRVARELQAAMPGGSLSVPFRLTASTRHVRSLRTLRFDYGSEFWEYVMGPDESKEYRWPRPGYTNAALSITHENRTLLFNPIRMTGDWALLKLMDEGQVSGSVINWTFTAIGQKQTATIGYEISGSGAEFIRSGHFSRFRCPSTVCP